MAPSQLKWLHCVPGAFQQWLTACRRFSLVRNLRSLSLYPFIAEGSLRGVACQPFRVGEAALTSPALLESPQPGEAPSEGVHGLRLVEAYGETVERSPNVQCLLSSPTDFRLVTCGYPAPLYNRLQPTDHLHLLHSNCERFLWWQESKRLLFQSLSERTVGIFILAFSLPSLCDVPLQTGLASQIRSLYQCAVSATLHGCMALSCHEPVSRLSFRYLHPISFATLPILRQNLRIRYPLSHLSYNNSEQSKTAFETGHQLIPSAPSQAREAFFLLMDAMNTGLYQQRRPQMSGLLPDDDFQYGEYDGDLDASASHPIFTFDGLPALSRSSSQHLMNSSSPASSNILSSSYSNLMQPIPMSQPSISWTDPSLTSGGFQENHHSYGGYSASNINGHNGSFPRGAEYHQPRYMSNLYSINDNNMCLEESFAPSYILDSNRHGMQHSPVMSSPFDHQHMSNARDFQRMSISNSPVPKMEPEESRIDFSSFSLPSSEASDEGNTSREMTAAEVEDQNEHHPEEPYAKLIHRALMSVPTKSMVLQEIYQWFRDNTQKGKMDSSKGWMNSIRHNLSMNAVCLPRLTISAC